MKHNHFPVLLLLLTLCACSTDRFVNDLIPAPQVCEVGNGHFKVNPAAIAEALCDDADLPDSPEGYILDVTADGAVTMRARSCDGLFYAHKTLDWLLEDNDGYLPELHIVDWPRFKYRGLQLDVSRHFFDKDMIKKQLRVWSELKLNRFHWHLTDGSAWRLEIEGYPKLTEGIPHYTREDVLEVLALADSLHIVVIPEIEMFSHSTEVLAVYPELACEGKAGRSNEFCIGKEATFEFLETALGQVIDLFSSEYIHIGGDEANLKIWEDCPDCIRRMKKEGISETSGLQSYGIRRISDFLASRGRKMIGWDEIMKGGLAPGATVMSWTGEENGRLAASMGHDVVMTPYGYCYINNAQDNPAVEPRGQGDYLSLETVYSYDPRYNLQDSSYIIGVQANLWTEWVETLDHMEYMFYPRAFAIAEIGWDYPSNKDYPAFRKRALKFIDKMRARGYNTFDLANEQGARPEARKELKHKAVGCSVSYDTPYLPKYDGGGDTALTDGRLGSWDYMRVWQGFPDSDIIATVDLGKLRKIKYVGADFGQWPGSWVWMPVKVEFEGSADGREFFPLCSIQNDIGTDDPRPVFKEYGSDVKAKVRFVRMHAYIPECESGWLFTDEIIIR